MYNKVLNWYRRYGVTAFLFIATIGVGYCVRPFWHNETPMPKNLMDKIN